MIVRSVASSSRAPCVLAVALAAVASACGASSPPEAPPRTPPPIPSVPSASTSTASPAAPPKIAKPSGPPIPVESYPTLVPTGDAPLGTKAPSVLMDAAPDGRWAVICEARKDTDHDGRIAVDVGYHGDTHGDALEPYLVMGSGPGEAIDDVVASDRSGRWLAFVRGGRLVLRDMSSGRDEDLSKRGADVATDDAPLAGHRAGGFDDAGSRFFYLAKANGETRIVVRDLATGAEAAVSAGRDLVDRAFLVGDGAWVVARVVLADTNGNGKVEAPRAHTTLAPRRCRGPAMSYSTGGGGGDKTVVRAARVGKDPKLGPLPGTFVASLGARLLLRRSDDALVAYDATKATREWVPASCKGRVQAIAPTFDRALVACAAPGEEHAPMEIAGDAGRRSLHMDGWGSTSVEEHIAVTSEPAIDEVHTDSRPYPTVDFETAKVTREAALPNDAVIGAVGDNELVETIDWESHTMDNATLLFHDKRTNAVKKIADGLGFLAPHVEGGLALCGPLLVDIGAARVLGRVTSQPYVLHPSGRVLVRYVEPDAAPQGGLAPAQFRWVGAGPPK